MHVYPAILQQINKLFDNDMNYPIIPIEEKHIESFWQAVDEVAREHKYLAFLEGPPIETTYDFVRGNIEGGWPQIVALDNDKVIGWCDICSLDRPVFAHCGMLGLAVLKAYRGQGLGKALMQKALTLAKAKGLSRIELTVYQTNTNAIQLYEQFGFVLEGIKRKAALIDGHYIDVLCMARLDY